MLVSKVAKSSLAVIAGVVMAASASLLFASVVYAAPDPVEPELVEPIVTDDVVRPLPVAPSGRFAREKSNDRAQVDPRFKETADRMLKVARSLKGSRYKLGGTTPAGFDCSGYIGYILNEIGLPALPRVSHDMYEAVSQIDRKDAEPGDLVFFHGKFGFVYHVGIYAGGNDMWHAPQTGKSVSFDPIYSSKATFGRVIKQG